MTLVHIKFSWCFTDRDVMPASKPKTPQIPHSCAFLRQRCNTCIQTRKSSKYQGVRQVEGLYPRSQTRATRATFASGALFPLTQTGAPTSKILLWKKCADKEVNKKFMSESFFEKKFLSAHPSRLNIGPPPKKRKRTQTKSKNNLGVSRKKKGEFQSPFPMHISEKSRAGREI